MQVFRKIKIIYPVVALFFLITPIFTHAQPTVNLETAVYNCAQYLEDRFPKGTRALLSYVQCENPLLGEFVLGNISKVLVNGGWFIIIERDPLTHANIKNEIDRQLCGFASQETELRIGRELAGQVIISGNISKPDSNWRLSIKAVCIETAVILAEWSSPVRIDSSFTSLFMQESVGLSFDGDYPLTPRDKQIIINGLRNAMQAQDTHFVLDETNTSGNGYAFRITIYEYPVVGYSYIRIMAGISFLKDNRVLSQSGDFSIIELNQVELARRITEKISENTDFFNTVSEVAGK